MLKRTVCATTNFKGSIMERLRQRTNYNKGLITGEAYSKSVNRVTANFSQVFDLDGDAQSIRDLVPHQRIAEVKKLSYPVVNPVQMSKVTRLPSKRGEIVNYKAENASARYTLRGDNLAYAQIPVLETEYEFSPSKTPKFTTVDEKMASYLYQRALSRASSAQFDFGVTVGEIAETAAFLAKPLTSLVSISNQALRGISHIRTVGLNTYVRISKKASKRTIRRILESTHAANPLTPGIRILNESANHWLAYKFGVLPILDDISKLTEFKEKNIQRLLGVRVARVKSMKVDTTTSTLFSGVPFATWFKLDGLRLKRVIDQHTFGLYFKDRITNPLANFMAGLGFAPFNVFTLAWELIPLSFVVDRFIDIKSFVKGNLGGLSKDLLTYYCTRKVLTTYTCDVTKLVCGYPTRISCSADKALHCSVTTEQMARVVNLDRPKFPVVNPLWQEQLKADATNLALIWSRLQSSVGKHL